MTICFLLEDLNLKTGVTLPAGAILVVPLQLVQMDESTWGSDAGQFNPHRLLSNAEKKSDSVHLTSFAGFYSAYDLRYLSPLYFINSWHGFPYAKSTVIVR